MAWRALERHHGVQKPETHQPETDQPQAIEEQPMMLTPIIQRRLWAIGTLEVAVICLTFGLLYGTHRGWPWMAMAIVAVGAVAAVLAVPAYLRMRRDNAASGSEPLPRDSPMWTWLLVEIVCFGVLLVLSLIQFDPPLSLVSAGGFAMALGACLVMLRKRPRQPKG
jgi:hypothetical protein